MGMYVQLHAVKPAEIDHFLADPDDIESLLSSGGRGSSLSLEKAWHGLHFLLTGSAWEGEGPLGFLLQGGEPIGEDLGYGPARLIRQGEVPPLNAALSHVTGDLLWSRFDRERMEEEQIYPGIWDEPEEELREEYVTYFAELKKLVAQASADGKGLVIVLG